MLVALDCARRLGQGLQRALPSSPQWTAVRYRRNRKPLWLGTAKSKIFRIPPRNIPPKDEAQEMKRIKDYYSTYIRSLRLFQREANEKQDLATIDHALELTEEAEIGKLVEEIERDNALVRSIREAALVDEWKQKEQHILSQKAALELSEQELQKETEKRLQYNIERLKHSIRLDNLDEAIEKALATEVDHNFAIDKTGTTYPGRLNSSEPAQRVEA